MAITCRAVYRIWNEALKLLFVAPEICSPWSEGRKVFVRDLAESMQNEHEVRLLTTTPEGDVVNPDIQTYQFECKSRLQIMRSVFSELPKIIEQFNPDVVCHFPYGTFRHVYGIINRYYMGRVDRICKERDIPCISIMYSIDDSISPDKLNESVACLALGQRESWNGNLVNPGLRFNSAIRNDNQRKTGFCLWRACGRQARKESNMCYR